MKLLRERVEDVEYLTEENNGQKNYYLKGVYLQAGIPNKNSRIYPPPILEREVTRYLREHVSRGTAYGALDHPSGPESSQVKMRDASHRITELTRDGNNWLGKSVILNEGLGKIAIGCLQTGGRLGVSSRGLGSVKPDRSGISIVQEDFRLVVAADIVSNPSAPDAMMTGIMENVDWVLNDAGELVREFIHETRKTVHETPKNDVNKVAIFESFITAIHEGKTVERLAALANVDSDKALAAFKRAKVHAKLTGNPADPTFIYRKAKEFLGVQSRNQA